MPFEIQLIILIVANIVVWSWLIHGFKKNGEK